MFLTGDGYSVNGLWACSMMTVAVDSTTTITSSEEVTLSLPVTVSLIMCSPTGIKNVGLTPFAISVPIPLQYPDIIDHHSGWHRCCNFVGIGDACKETSHSQVQNKIEGSPEYLLVVCHRERSRIEIIFHLCRQRSVGFPIPSSRSCRSQNVR